MEEKVVENCNTLWSIIFSETGFWSAIFGAIVGAVAGGLIAYMIQVKALREGRNQRDGDHRKLQQALGNALLFKMIRINSNFYGIHQHIEDRFADAAQREFKGEPWQFYLPIANPPDPVHFSSEEMGMLLALKNDDVFNTVLQTDVIHNSLIEVVKVLNAEREALTERFKADESDGTILSSFLDKDQMMALRPKMIVVNSLIEDVRDRAKTDFEESVGALDGLHKVLRDNLGLAYKLESKVKPTVASA
ncbi:MAG: hypothetical protein QF654_01590 [Alphaproteobacteria bacterium]|jgi:hypothetical protein|nr:hypothetical protein [Alphaproteobacteria bacterium]|tara:strand:+ start:319 stop:1062 length:744 start_codon:yes stop_codon:yes gene_type:complete